MFRMSTYGIGCCVLSMTLLIFTQVPAAAQTQLPGPCAETVEKYCRDVVPGAGRVMKCLNDHRDDQSPFCRDWIAEQQKSLKDLNTACYEEIAKLCRIDPPNGLMIFQCLNDNYAGLKLDCRDKLREIKDRLQ